MIITEIHPQHQGEPLLITVGCHHDPLHITLTLISPLSQPRGIAMSEKLSLKWILLSHSLAQAPMEFSKCYKSGCVLLFFQEPFFFNIYQLY